MNHGESNVFVVDWGAIADTAIVNYVDVRYSIKDVSSVVADFLRFLNEKKLFYQNVTIVGHSLGAHIAGLTGKQINRIGNIVALDPAGLLLQMEDNENKVISSDAEYVQSIQTSVFKLGMQFPVGQVAYYPHWGGTQPGCGYDVFGRCSHSRAWQYFAESINNNKFWGKRCRRHFMVSIWDHECEPIEPTSRMGGEPLTKGLKGVYFLETNEKPPYAKGVI